MWQGQFGWSSALFFVTLSACSSNPNLSQPKVSPSKQQLQSLPNPELSANPSEATRPGSGEGGEIPATFARIYNHPELGENVWQLGDLIWGDTVTMNLLSEDGPSVWRMTYQRAVDYCAGIRTRDGTLLGARLPSTEEWYYYQAARETEVSRQVLTSLEDWFWSLDLDEGVEDQGYVFNGRLGGIFLDDLTHLNSVQCVFQSTAPIPD